MSTYKTPLRPDELYHYGILGMKWGVRRYQNKDGSLTSSGKKRYRSTGIRSAIARVQNASVDRSFKKWKTNDTRKEDAIALGKKRNDAKLAYESDKSNLDAKTRYKQANKDYKKALRSNTTYRKGSIRGEVGKDISRKYLTEAKRVRKLLDKDPTNKELQKKYNSLMSKHDVERAKARKAPSVGARRSRRIRAVKRGMTMTIKAAAATAVIGVGIKAVNQYAPGLSVQLNTEDVQRYIRAGAKMFRYMY